MLSASLPYSLPVAAMADRLPFCKWRTSLETLLKRRGRKAISISSGLLNWLGGGAVALIVTRRFSLARFNCKLISL